MIPLELLPSLHAGAECDAELIAWRLPAGPRVTVVAKIAFAIAPGAVSRLLPAVALIDKDGAAGASELAPLMPRAEVLVVGSAVGRARLLVTRKNTTSIDKTSGGGFGPIDAQSPERAARLGTLPASALERSPLELPAGFDFTYFNAAPADQQVSVMKGDETIVLESSHPTPSRLELRLPGVLVVARFVQPKGRPIKVLPLLPDRLVLDTDTQVGTLVYRAGFAIDWAALAKHRVEVGLATPSETLRFPDPEDPALFRSHTHRAQLHAALSTSSTGTADITDAIAPSLPFAGRLPRIAPLPQPAPRAELPFEALPDTARSVGAPPREEVERQGDGVPTLSDAPLAVTAFHFQLEPPKDALVIVVKASFQLVPDGPAAILEEAEAAAGDVFVDDDPEKALLHADDFVVFKSEVDVLLEGTAYAPGGSASAMKVTMSVRGARGSIDRSLLVLGDRIWQGGALQLFASDPAPFTSMPISYARAFGGPAFDQNPHGIGYRAGSDGVRRLPNLEDPTKLVQSPTDTPPPASLSGVHPMSPARAGLLGTYSGAWARTRWPYFAADLDARAFQAAPPSQRLSALDGDEEYELTGVHPELSSLRGRLPGVRVRVFVQRTRAAGGEFLEVPVRIDTLTFAPDAGALHLVWRGSLDVSDDDAPEIAHIFATTEPLAGPALTLEEARARWLAASTPARSDEEEEATFDPSPDEPEDDDEARAIEEEIRAHEERVRIAAPETVNDDGPPIPEAEPEDIARAMREAGANEEEIAELMDALLPEGTQPPPPPDPDLRREVMRRIEEGEPLSDLELQGADLSDLDLSAQSLERSDLSGAKLDRANLTSCDATAANLSGASLVDATLEQALLGGADLTGADLTRARASNALFDGAEARGVKARSADFTEAMMGAAIFAGSDFSDAKLERADLAAADFSSCRLDRTSFKKSSMPAVRLYDVAGEAATFDEAQMGGARAEGATLERCSFRELHAAESVWERAKLDGSIFFGADLRAASFVRADCEGTIFSEADLANARLKRGNLRRASLLVANLSDTDCDRARFDGADLRGANLHGASLQRASLHEAKLDAAITTQTLLDRRQPL